jgi:hypothetical protein
MTLIIDKEAFRFYTPKELHPHLKQFDACLAATARKDLSIKALVDQHLSVFSVEKYFPIVHLIALFKDGRWIYFPAPPRQYKRKEGHRVVSERTSEGPSGMSPFLRLEVVSDPNLTAISPEAAMRILRLGAMTDNSDEMEAYTKRANEASRPAVLFTAPMAMMKRSVAHQYLAKRFTLYQHIFGQGHEYPEDGPFYIGITARDWKRRWSEHRAAILRGSMLKFHRTYRERATGKQLTYVHHKVMGVATTLEEIQDLEEIFVEGHWEDARLLNMIPGGRAGLAYLHERGMTGNHGMSSPDDAEKVLETWLQEHPRKGLPAPWVTEKWKDDGYALNVICGPEGRLTVEQIISIRSMAQGGIHTDDIVSIVGAKNRQQVQRVIEGRTYSRIKKNSE